MSMSKSTAMNERIDKALFARAQTRGTWSTVSNQGDGLVRPMAQGNALWFRFLNFLLGPRAIVSSENSPIDSLVYVRNCTFARASFASVLDT